MIYILDSFFNLLFEFVELIIIADCIFSFVFPYDSNNKYVKIVRIITDPILEPFRRLQNKYMSGLGIDISPILALVALAIIKRIIFGVIR